jgi:thiol-disulfide isomerase/thioredoxin
VGVLWLLVGLTAVSGIPGTFAGEEPQPPKVSLDAIAALIGGAPLGPWADLEPHPLALVLWPEGPTAPNAPPAVEEIAATYANVGAGARVLSINGPSGPVPNATAPRSAVKKLAALAGRDGRRALKQQTDSPVGLIRWSDGRLVCVGSLDLEHKGYNLVRGLKDALDVRFRDLAPLDKVTITTLDGSPVSLRSYLDSLPTDVALLDLWGTWCPPCQRSLPHLKRLSKRYDGRVSFVGVTCEAGETLEERREALENYQKSEGRIPYSLLLGDLWGLRLNVPVFLGYPTLMLLKRSKSSWVITWQQVGFEPGEEKILEALLAGAAGPADERPK